MDQIRKAVVWLKQHHFWVLSALAAMIALVCWKMAAAKLVKDFLTNRSTITTEFKNEKDLRDKPFKPNDDIIKKQFEQIDLQSKNVYSIWKTLYERQSKKVLTWPPDLSQDFRDYVTKHKFGDEIPGKLRDNYRDYIDRHFESLPKQIGARVLAENEVGGMGGAGGMGGGERFVRGGGRGVFGGEGGPTFRPGDEGGVTPGAQDDDYICEWPNQGLVREELNFRTTPSATKIWVTQEDLWVYHTLLDIIENTNNAAHADRMSNAAVRKIISFEVGQPAAMASQARGRVELLRPSSSGAASTADGESVGLEMRSERMRPERGGEMPGPVFMGREGGGFGGGQGPSPEQEKAALLAERYLDETGKPIGGMSAATGESSDSGQSAAPSAELPKGAFKRLPIRMTLEMDQCWLTHLISQCASQPLPVEVTEVRINPQDGGVGGGEGMRYGGSMMDSSRGGGGSSYQPRLSANGAIMTFPLHPNRVTVVIQGIVTIFNEPDPNLLKSDAGKQVAAAP